MIEAIRIGLADAAREAEFAREILTHSMIIARLAGGMGFRVPFLTAACGFVVSIVKYR